MREILFRGRRAYDRQWIEGNLIKVTGLSEGSTESIVNWGPEDWEVTGNIFDDAEKFGIKS